jgi:hypothetical protein
MFDSSLYVKSEMDYRAEKIRRGVAVRRHRNRNPLVRRRSRPTEITN